MDRKAFITGITGQDGSYLCDILLERGYKVHGLVRHTSNPNLNRIASNINKITLYNGDVTDPCSLSSAYLQYSQQSGESFIFHMADQDSVPWSGYMPLAQIDITLKSVQSLMVIIDKYVDKLFVPVSATIFGNAPALQTEETKIAPNSIYACNKAAVYHLLNFYRSRGAKVWTGIMYNHDSPRRNDGYLLQKICRTLLSIKRGRQQQMSIGDLSMKVDIGYAKDYMEAVVDMMSIAPPDNYIISNGVNGTITIREMIEIAMYKLGYDISVLPEIVKEDKSLSRDPVTLIGCYAKANKAFGYLPKVNVGQLIHKILEYHW